MEGGSEATRPEIATSKRLSRNEAAGLKLVGPPPENQTSQGESVMQNVVAAKDAAARPAQPSKAAVGAQDHRLISPDQPREEQQKAEEEKKKAQAAQRRNRRKQLPMIDFDEQDAYLKKMQQQAHQGNKDETSPKVKNQKKGKVIGNYVLGRDLGKGTFGEVMVGTHSLTGEKVAIKVLEKEKIIDVHDVERVAREIHILKIVRHPTIVQLYEIIETDKELYLIMEYARGGELFEYIVNRKRVREKDACKFLHQILSGVRYLHNLGICHRDLKPENLLMDDFNNIKIVDFGLSNTFKVGDKLQTACGSPCYAAPEMVAGQKYDGQAADMWSCGVIIYAMVCGFLPFEDPKTNKLYQKILHAEYSIPDFVSPACQDLIRKILCQNPAERLSIAEIRKHPWYQQVKVREHHGIYVGKNPIPVDPEIVKQIPAIERCEEQQAAKYVMNNRHNSITTIYYLILKRHLRKGGQSVADITKYKPEDFQPGASLSRVRAAPDEAGANGGEAKVQLASKNAKAAGGESSAPGDNKRKMVTQIKLRKDIDQSVKHQHVRLPDTGETYEEEEPDGPGRQEPRGELIAIQEKNTAVLQKPSIEGEPSRGRRNRPGKTEIPPQQQEGSVSPSPHRYFQQEEGQRRQGAAAGPGGEARSNLTTQRLNPHHRNFQIQGQGGVDQISQEIDSIDYSRQGKVASREQRHGSQPPVSSVLGLTPLRPLHHPLNKDQEMNQSANSFKQIQSNSQQMHILINESNATGTVQPPKLQKMPALPKQYQQDAASGDYEEMADSQHSQAQQLAGIDNDYRQQWQEHIVAQRPTKSRHSGRQAMAASNHHGATLKNQKIIPRRPQESNYHSAMGHYQTSKQADGAGPPALLLSNNVFAGQQHTLSQASQASPVSQGQRMGGGIGGPVIAASQAAQMMGNQPADSNRKVRRSMNVVLEKHKYNQHLNAQQMQAQQQTMLKRQGPLPEAEGIAMGRNAALANASKKYANHSLNFADQQSAGSDFNYEAALPPGEATVFQHTQQIGKPQKGGKPRSNQFQLQQMQLAQMANPGQTQTVLAPGLRPKNGQQPALLQHRHNVKGIRSTRGATVALERQQQYQSQEQVPTAAQMTSDLLMMAPLNQPTLKKGHGLGYPGPGNQTEMNFYRGSVSKQQPNGKYAGNQKHQHSTDGGGSVNLPNMGPQNPNARAPKEQRAQHGGNIANMVQTNYQNGALTGAKHGKRGSQEVHDRLPTRGGAAGPAHARYASDAAAILPKEPREPLQVGTASSNKESNQALSGTSRISGASYISEVHGNPRMLGSVDIAANGNLNDFQIQNPGDYSKSSKRKNRQITFYPELNQKAMQPQMEPKNQTYLQFYPGDQSLLKAQQQNVLTLNRNPKISNKYESMRQKQNQRLLNQSYDFTMNSEMQSALLQGKKAQGVQQKQQQVDRKPTRQQPHQANHSMMDDYAMAQTRQAMAPTATATNGKAVYLNPIVHQSVQQNQKMGGNQIKNEQQAYHQMHQNQNQKLDEIQNIIRKSKQKQQTDMLIQGGNPRKGLGQLTYKY